MILPYHDFYSSFPVISLCGNCLRNTNEMVGKRTDQGAKNNPCVWPMVATFQNSTCILNVRLFCRVLCNATDILHSKQMADWLLIKSIPKSLCVFGLEKLKKEPLRWQTLLWPQCFLCLSRDVPEPNCVLEITKFQNIYAHFHH